MQSHGKQIQLAIVGDAALQYCRSIHLRQKSARAKARYMVCPDLRVWCCRNTAGLGDSQGRTRHSISLPMLPLHPFSMDRRRPFSYNPHASSMLRVDDDGLHVQFSTCAATPVSKRTRGREDLQSKSYCTAAPQQVSRTISTCYPFSLEEEPC